MQIIGYWEDCTEFTEGPFVAVRKPMSMEPLYRVEERNPKGTGTCFIYSVIPWWPSGWKTKEEIQPIIDELNLLSN